MRTHPTPLTSPPRRQHGETGETGETEGATPEEIDASAPAEPDAAAPPPETRTVVEKTGPGFVPLVIGGVVAAGIGYFASVSGMLPGAGGTDNTAEIEAALARQSEVLAGLQDQVSTLATPTETPAIDLSPLTDEISALGARIEETAGAIDALGERVTTLEDRPVFTGDVTADNAEAAEAVAAMEEQMRAQAEEAERLAAEAEAAQRAAEEAIAAAEAEAAAAMAQAEADAEAATAQAEAEAALNELRLAIAQGGPFAEPLAAVAAVTDVPEALSAAADTGVPSLEDIQDAFPAAARAALPVALRETAGDGAVDRLTAFVQGQIGGRAVAPREGDDPDADPVAGPGRRVIRGPRGRAGGNLRAAGGRTGEMAAWIATPRPGPP
jgi:hypothetical protein